MPTSCSAMGCSSVYSKNGSISFHRFPVDPKRKEIWIQNVRRENFIPGRYHFLCSKHFKPACFDLTGQTKRLRGDAVPTIFINDSGSKCKEQLDRGPTSGQVNADDTINPTGSNWLVHLDHNYNFRDPQQAKQRVVILERKLSLLRKKLKTFKQKERRAKRRQMRKAGAVLKPGLLPATSNETPAPVPLLSPSLPPPPPPLFVFLPLNTSDRVPREQLP
ncbi:THAP domain-containing protein 2-like isoform X2 [Polypterus senegalus]|uniref:THAP domain-containing protein 2-like isoform X2 n=1 Tax=Polypterus senegalus TaxID=55291 RepID=UPI00196462B2|nr:THAP domain-containing protein 2-like isoform X2 [Polypterus senegalus]